MRNVKTSVSVVLDSTLYLSTLTHSSNSVLFLPDGPLLTVSLLILIDARLFGSRQGRMPHWTMKMFQYFI